MKNKNLVEKHVKIARTLAAKNHGKLPSYTWLESHGYFFTYEVLRLHTVNFAGIPRAFRQ